MTIGLDHVIVPSHNRLEAAKFLAGLLSLTEPFADDLAPLPEVTSIDTT